MRHAKHAPAPESLVNRSSAHWRRHRCLTAPLSHPLGLLCPTPAGLGMRAALASRSYKREIFLMSSDAERMLPAMQARGGRSRAAGGAPRVPSALGVRLAARLDACYGWLCAALPRVSQLLACPYRRCRTCCAWAWSTS